MAWQDFYQPPTTDIWQGRHDLPANSVFYQWIKPCPLSQLTKHEAQTPAFALLGFCSDAGVKRNFGRAGASLGPAAIRKACASLSTSVFQQQIGYDVGDILCQADDLEAAQLALADAVTTLLNLNITPIILGGGHEVAYGHYLGLQNFLNSALTIVNFDAHFDMRPLLAENKGSSGTPFLQIAQTVQQLKQAFSYLCIGVQRFGNIDLLFKTAQEWQCQYLLAETIHLQPQEDAISTFLQASLPHALPIYVSICLDVFAAPFAPGVSAPQPFGLLPWQILPALRMLAESGCVLSYDLAELAPPLDQDERTAKLAAFLIAEIITNHVTGTP